MLALKHRDVAGNKRSKHPEGRRANKHRRTIDVDDSSPVTAPSMRSNAGLQLTSDNALDSHVLTPRVWMELADFWQIHYSADLSFLHQPTFIKPLRQAIGTVQTAESNVRPNGSALVLLCILTLTARFSPTLIAHHTPPGQDPDPVLVTEYYCNAAENEAHRVCRLGNVTLDDVQAALMLGYHSFGTCAGQAAWSYFGLASRTAQALSMHCQDHPELSLDISRGNGADRDELADQNDFIKEETRRRTMWSCFGLDRFGSCGRFRPQMLSISDMWLQLPAGEKSFTVAERVLTKMLNQENHTFTLRTHFADKMRVRIETDLSEGLISKYIRVIELFSKVAKWSCLGGRRTENSPPWHKTSNFNQLLLECNAFTTALPREYALLPQNTQAQINLKSSTPYVLMHVVLLMCQVMLHREYVPFAPIQCSKPEGPVDPPMLKHLEADMEPGWWEQSANQCFSSARKIIELSETCQEYGVLPETPFMAFALFTAAFTGIWCQAFPNMDLEGQLCDKSDRRTKRGAELSRKAEQILRDMQSRLPIAKERLQSLAMFTNYFANVKAPGPVKNTSRKGSTDDWHARSNKTVSGGGLDDYREIEEALHLVSSAGQCSRSLMMTSSGHSVQSDLDNKTPGALLFTSPTFSSPAELGGSQDEDIVEGQVELVIVSPPVALGAQQAEAALVGTHTGDTQILRTKESVEVTGLPPGTALNPAVNLFSAHPHNPFHPQVATFQSMSGGPQELTYPPWEGAMMLGPGITQYTIDQPTQMLVPQLDANVPASAQSGVYLQMAPDAMLTQQDVQRQSEQYIYSEWLGQQHQEQQQSQPQRHNQQYRPLLGEFGARDAWNGRPCLYGNRPST